MKIALLSGDAGCGKSHALSLLYRTLTGMSVTVAVSAMTNRAVGCLAGMGAVRCVYTLHRLMGLKKDLLDEKMPQSEFEAKYLREYRDARVRFAQMYKSRVPQGKGSQQHSCESPRPESCAVCSRVIEKMRGDKGPMAGAPPFLGVNVLIVDEYGLMTSVLLERLLFCLSSFYGPKNGPLIVLCGSVSQLQPPGGTSERVWQNDRLEKLLCSSTHLVVNRRQFSDPGYAEATSYLQFNVVSEEARRIFRSQVTVTEKELMDPTYEPDRVRIFHREDLKCAYTAAYVEARKGSPFGPTCLILTEDQKRSSEITPISRRQVLERAVHALPKLFIMPKNFPAAPGDYLKCKGFWRGCRVTLIWHMDRSGIRISGDVDVRDTEGTVQDIKFNDKRGFCEFHVKGSQSHNVYVVGPSEWRCANWTLRVHPLACLVAMNTYECQGCSLNGQVFYHPPRHFFMSPLKPSVYVALTRVTKRDDLQMTNCNFAENVGSVSIYDERLVSHRKRVEMNYSS
ncbi:hypothetical protein WMY93_031097 [Mugilogobius chulae]|uniref:DNA helicase n=1 Tax=Mugilogobius chulae TaxID=88201 RepID=A0AAW0MJ16_9GOBI